LITSNGNLWRVVGNNAEPRIGTNVTGVSTTGAQTPIAGPTRSMLGSDDGTFGVLLGGTGIAYLYDGLADTYTTAQQLFTAPIIGYYGPLGVAPTASFLLANGLVTNHALTPIGGAATPGQVTPPTIPTMPGVLPTFGVASTGSRNVAAVAPVGTNHFVRMTT